MKKVLAGVVGIALLAAILFSFVDDFRLALRLFLINQWVPGSYHDPVWTPLEATSGLICALLVLAVLLAVIRARRRHETLDLNVSGFPVFLSLLVVGAVSGLALPFIHWEEVDVSERGFATTHYSVPMADSVRFYNSGSAPVTVVAADPQAPEVLKAPGLTLRPGQATVIGFPREGTYHLSLVGTGAMSIVESFAPSDDPGPDSPF